MIITLAIILALTVVIGSAAAHCEAIRSPDRFARRAERPCPARLVVIRSRVGLHLPEIGADALLFALRARFVAFGVFQGAPLASPRDDFQYSAEAYSSLGYGDVNPTGALRRIASVAPLKGILLLTWSGSFLFPLAENWRSRGV